MKTGKKTLAMILAVCMLLGSIAAATGTEQEPGTGSGVGSGTEPEPGTKSDSTDGNLILDASISDIMNLHYTDPLENVVVTEPYNAAPGATILMTKENELLLHSSNRDDENVADTYHTFEKMTSATSYTATSSFPAALNMSFVTAVALNATGNGSDDHVAYLGVKTDSSGNRSLRVVLYNARKKTPAATLDIEETVGSWVTQVEHWAYKTFFSITAGDYDNDGIDEIACTDASMGVQMIEIKKDINGALTLTKGQLYKWNDLVRSTVSEKMTVTDGSAIHHRALISLATGNFDGTGAEELAVAVSTNNPKDSSYLPSALVACTTQLAVVMSPLSDSPTIRTTSIRTTDKDTTSGTTLHTVLYVGQITAGDMNGDRKDDIVVAGYPGKVIVTSTSEPAGQYVLERAFEEVEQENVYAVGLCYATLDGDSSDPSLGISRITTSAMTPFFDEGFYAGNDLFMPLSVDAAKLHGQYGKESVFMGGRVYQFEGEQAHTLYTHAFFRKRSSSAYSDAYVEHVTSGVFSGTGPAGKKMVNEQFVFTVVQKDNGNREYNYKVGFISMDADGNFSDNTAKMNSDGYLLDERPGGVVHGTALVPVAVDIDEDGLRVKYSRAYGYYEDPTVEAVLQAAPYFHELSAWYNGSGSTTYSVSVERSLIDLKGHTHSIHFGAKGKVGNDVTGELEAKVGYALDMDFQHEWAYTAAYTTTFEAGPYDTVVVQRTPYICYEYQCVNIKGEPLTGEDEGSVVFMEPMKPHYFQLSVEEYNQFVDQYNSMADRHDAEGKTIEGTDNYRLVKITEEILPTNATGKPENYFSTSYGSENISQGPHTLGHGGGSSSSSFSSEVSYTYTANYAHGAHLEAEGVAMVFPGIAGIGAFVESSFQKTVGSGRAEINTTETGGTVANINGNNNDTLAMYGFTWRCVLWHKSLMTNVEGAPYLDANQEEMQVPVVGYVVTDVKRPLSAPTDLVAYLGNTGREVMLEWTPMLNDALLGYSVYRSYDDRDPEPVKGTDVTYLSSSVYQMTDDTVLKPGKIYSYFVVARYNSENIAYKSINSNTSTVVWGIPTTFCSCSSKEDDELPG